MAAPRIRGIVNHYNKCSDEITYYFDHVEKLVEEFPINVAISYMFGLVELAQNNTLYCGVVKLHRAHSEVARNVVDHQHLTRSGFKDLFEKIFGQPLKATITKNIEHAEMVRDKILHGKNVSEESKRQAVVDILEYAEEFNKFTDKLAGFKPFGSLRGFKGRGRPLDKSTSKWILKGMGFGI